MTRQYHYISKQTIAYENNPPKEFIVERIISLRLVGKKTITNTSYDKESGCVYQGAKQMLLTFEYCLDRKRLTLERPLKSATKFLQVIEHRYDWMEVDMNFQTGHIKIINKEKMLQNWKKMQKRLLLDYTGVTLDHYFQTLGDFSYPMDKEWPCLTQNTAFGLLFLGIPQDLNSGWLQNRDIYLSENDPIVEEQITFRNTIDNKHYFDITGNFSIEDKNIIRRNCIMDRYKGEIVKRSTNILPESVKINMNYQRDNYTIDWQFELYEQ